MDALTAAEKLKLNGYQRIMILKGGIESWRALGYPLEGESADSVPDPGIRLLLPEGQYQIDTDQPGFLKTLECILSLTLLVFR